MIADSLVILDNLFGRAIVLANVEVPANSSAAQRVRLFDAAEGRLDTLVARLGETHSLAPLSLDGGAPLKTDSRYPRSAFERDVVKIGAYIAAGDTFQTVLSRRQEVPGAVDPLRLYRYLRALNPAPYLFYLALDDVTLVGSSPEVLVRVEGDEVTVDRKSTRLNSSHTVISYAVFCFENKGRRQGAYDRDGERQGARRHLRGAARKPDDRGRLSHLRRPADRQPHSDDAARHDVAQPAS